MSFAETASSDRSRASTIFLGRWRACLVAPKHMAFLNAMAIGILFFLFFDIVAHAVEPGGDRGEDRSNDLPLLLSCSSGVFWSAC